MSRLALLVSIVSFLAWGTARVVNWIEYTRQIGGHLKLAADANSIDLAHRKIGQALEGMEEWGLCNEGGDDCYTSVLYRTPDEDVGFWRENVEATFEDLSSMTEAERADNLTESNQLMKVRETLVDGSSYGPEVTAPSGASLYPHNVGYAWWAIFSGLGIVVSAVSLIRE